MKAKRTKVGRYLTGVYPLGPGLGGPDGEDAGTGPYVHDNLVLEYVGVSHYGCFPRR